MAAEAGSVALRRSPVCVKPSSTKRWLLLNECVTVPLATMTSRDIAVASAISICIVAPCAKVLALMPVITGRGASWAEPPTVRNR